jgi:hypothetical protein
MIKPQSIPSGKAIEPVTQSTIPNKINVPNNGTVSRFAKGAMMEIWVNVKAKMGSVAIWAANVTATVSVRRIAKGNRSMGRKKR